MFVTTPLPYTRYALQSAELVRIVESDVHIHFMSMTKTKRSLNTNVLFLSMVIGKRLRSWHILLRDTESTYK